MGRPALSLLALALSAIAALAFASCGGEDAKLLPGETAREITANLDAVKQLAGEGDCVGAEDAAQQVSEQVEALGGVDEKLKRALREGASRLSEVIASCEEAATEAIAPALPTEPEDEEAKPPKEKKEKPKKEETQSTTPEPTTAEPALPPQANGKGKGLENGNGPGEGEEGSEEGPSGGVGPGNPVGGEE